MKIIGTDGNPTSNVGLTVQQAYSIDSKIDDGLPQSGRVIAQYIAYGYAWAAGGGGAGTSPGGVATPPTRCNIP